MHLVTKDTVITDTMALIVVVIGTVRRFSPGCERRFPRHWRQSIWQRQLQTFSACPKWRGRSGARWEFFKSA
jgi:hypothetical protein